ncbi:uncharacterized protein LOC143535296 [Bidens hawaiensis]|uniref:uncharacterized protein LOC143535296 n=1 Tax=Bidens hawaiensis TaxID=980011 RepID=UPI00404B91A1
MADDKEGNSKTMKDMISGFVLQAPKLTSTNYASWSVMVKVFLGANGFHDAIDKERGQELKKERDMILQMAKYSEPKDAWEALRVRYLGVERTQNACVQMLRTELDGLKIVETENIDTVTFEDVVGHLKAYEKRNKFKNVNGSSSQSPLMLNQTEKKIKTTEDVVETVEDTMEEEERIQDGIVNVRIMNGVKIVKGIMKNGKIEEICSIKKVSLNEERVIPGAFEKDEKNKGTWYLDNGASHHMSRKEFFTTLDEQIWGQVKFGDGSEIEIKCKGNVTVVSMTGEKKWFCDVFYMPKLKTNLLSLRKLDEEGCKIEIANGTLRLYDQKGRLLMKVQITLNMMYNIKLYVCCNP